MSGERLPDRVMLADFERYLDLAENEVPDLNSDQAYALWLEFAKFMDANGRRLALLARMCVEAMERQSSEPT